MASDFEKLAGVKSYLARKRSVAELKALADEVFASATEEVTLTSNSYEGGSASGVVSFPKWLLLQAIEEILQEAGEVPATGGRQLFSYPSYQGQESRT